MGNQFLALKAKAFSSFNLVTAFNFETTRYERIIFNIQSNLKPVVFVEKLISKLPWKYSANTAQRPRKPF